MNTERKVATIIGARPQFIKASAVSAAFNQQTGLEELLIHTGQHHDANMSAVFFTELGIPQPAYNLGIQGGRHGAMTGRMLEAVEEALIEIEPDVVLVYGDTNSTLAGALAAAKLHIPVAHVEAGLRSFNLAMPEEVNRILTDRISHWLFTPSRDATAQLRREGVEEAKISEVGDVMYDVSLLHGSRVGEDDDFFDRLGIEPGKFALATVHRAENTDHRARLEVIVEALIGLAATIPVVLPLHPRTRKILAEAGMLDRVETNLTTMPPASYLDMVRLEKFAALVATDSGGVQKEAFFFEVPCVTLRDETEWVELVDGGWNRLAPPHDTSGVLATLRAALGSRGEEMQPFGSGNAAVQIAERLAADIH